MPVTSMRLLFGAVLAAGLVAPAPSAAGDAQPRVFEARLDAKLIRKVDAYRREHEKAIVGALDALTRIRSIEADPAGVAAAASHLESLLKARGFVTAQLSVPGSMPAVYGSLAVKGAKRTVVFYAHYDGQPVTPSEWTSDPFVPVMRSGPLGSGERSVDWKNAPSLDPEWRLFGRAVADDKTSIIAFLAAFDALEATGRRPSVNLKVFWEGEEESGSAHLPEILRNNTARLKSDLWIIGDGPVHQSRRRMITFGARGVVGLEATVYGARRSVHDGHYGNWAPNPAAMAAELISSMRAPDGRVLIPGFLDDVRPLTLAESEAVASLPPVEDPLRRELWIARGESDDGLTASILRPSMNVRGIRSGQVGAEAVNAIPIDATVSIDFRLVPNQTPERVRQTVESFLRAQGWTIVAETPDSAARLAHPRIVKLDWQGGYPALRSDLSTPAAGAVLAAAQLAQGGPISGPIAVMPMMGGSLPLYIFHEAFKVPVIGLPVVNHDNNQHAANENLRLQNLWDGISTYAALMATLDW
jgi:acetylornithine deacetylase/succinyl-diaminopimelate desuccinylase-like protein